MIHKGLASIFAVLLCCCLLLASIDAAPVYANYKVALNNANQQRLQNLLDPSTGICGSDATILGHLNTSDNGIVVMVLTDDATQTLAAWEATSCGKALVTDSWATRVVLPVDKTDQTFQAECFYESVATCGMTATSLCPCSPLQTAIYTLNISKQADMAALRLSGGVCYQQSHVIAPLNTVEGILVVVHSPANGKTMWDFEVSPCGKAVIALTQDSEFDMTVIQPILDECYEHGDHGHCGTTETTLCRCSTAQNLIFAIPTANVAAYNALLTTGGACAGTAASTLPSRTQIFADVNVKDGIQLYVLTTAGRTKYDFDNTTCGLQINLLKDSVKVGTDAQAVVDECWAHGDHAHCGTASCPCPVPASLNVTPLVITMNITHVDTEGLLFFNNYFMKTVRADDNCSFSRYLATYADGAGFSLRIYIDAFKTSTCTLAKLNVLKETAFGVYWTDAVLRWNNGGGEEEEEEEDSHAGHNHFAIMATDTTGPYVAGITSIKIETAINLDVDACWNPSTDGIKCKAEADECSEIFCALGSHCHSNDECSTGACGELTDDHGHDDDHSGHNHNVITLSSYRTLYYSEWYGMNIDQVTSDQVQMAMVTQAEDDHAEHPDYVCILKSNGAILPSIFGLVAVVLAVALF